MNTTMSSAPTTLKVDTLIDENDGDLSQGDVSLREAIAAVTDGGVITFSQQLSASNAGAGQGVIELSLGTLIIDKSVNIQGLGKDQLTVSGGNRSRVFLIDGDDVVIDSLTISDGSAGQGGGAILTRGNLSVVNSLITGNSSGISNEYYDRSFMPVDLLIENSTIEDNRGDGIASTGTITITNSRIANNAGFGVENYSSTGGDTVVTDSVIADNRLDGIAARGGAYGKGTAKVINSTISGNGGTAVEASGGRFYSGGEIEVSSSVISGNGRGLITGDADYGSIRVESSTVSGNKGIVLSSYGIAVKYSSIVDNQGTGITANDITVENSTLAQNQGSGIINRPGFYEPVSTSLIINNSTISGNGSIAVKAGGIATSDIYRDSYLPSTVRITNTTISDNVGSEAGGVLVESFLMDDGEPYGDNRTVLENTIIAGNAGAVPDISAKNIESNGHNLIGDGSGVTGLSETDLVGTRSQPLDPKLGALQDNGGPAPTQEPLPNSPVIDAGNPRTSQGLDQRGNGFPRVLDGNGDGSATVDIGAVEAAGTIIRNMIDGDNRRNRLLGTGKSDLINGFGSRDFINGRGGDDLLFGGSQQDRIIGGAGDDIITGGRGSDRLSGNGGQDTFVYESVHDGRDLILDFRIGQDRIDLSTIFDNRRYDSDDVFEDYVRLGKTVNGSDTRFSVLDIGASSAQRAVFRTLAVIEGVNADHVDASSFIL